MQDTILQEVCIKVTARWISDADIWLNIKPIPRAFKSFLPAFMDNTAQEYLSICVGIQKVEVRGSTVIREENQE
jgi:hypothetical protein